MAHSALPLRDPQELGQDSGDDLPGEAVLVLQPAALLRLRVPALRQLLPGAIELLLRVAVACNEIASVNGTPAPIQCRDRRTVELERDGHDGSRFSRVYFL